MRHLTYICHLLSTFKLLIANDIHYYPSSIQNIFLIFTYDTTYAWCRNLMGYIIKFLITSSIFLMGGSSNFTPLKMLYSSSWLFSTSRDTQPSYTITSCNVSPSTFVVFHCNHFFLFPLSITHHFHNVPC